MTTENPLNRIRPTNLRGWIVLAAALACLSVNADDWPQWLGPQRDGVWRETGLVETFPTDGPRIRWRTAIGSGYSGPAVANGRVYVHDRKLPTGASNPENPFDRGGIPGTERVLCLDEQDGRILWTHEYDCVYTVSYAAGPRVTPLVHEGKVYTLGAEGNLRCLNAATGEKVWARELGRKGIRVNAVAPGFIATEMVDTVPENVIEQMVGKTPLARLGQPGDIANAYIFLASDLASFISGTVLSVDGGLVI